MCDHIAGVEDGDPFSEWVEWSENLPENGCFDQEEPFDDAGNSCLDYSPSGFPSDVDPDYPYITD